MMLGLALGGEHRLHGHPVPHRGLPPEALARERAGAGDGYYYFSSCELGLTTTMMFAKAVASWSKKGQSVPQTSLPLLT